MIGVPARQGDRQAVPRINACRRGKVRNDLVAGFDC
jgi:hypothetical protein